MYRHTLLQIVVIYVSRPIYFIVVHFASGSFAVKHIRLSRCARLLFQFFNIVCFYAIRLTFPCPLPVAFQSRRKITRNEVGR
jgi:hypothetical protein